MSKTLSTGTLSLRFMQNAQRAKQLKEVELERAEVQDDGKWEVSQAVKDAWGLGNAGALSSSQASDLYEASYLPFIFGDSERGVDEVPARALGRRVFNKRGEDVSLTGLAADLPEVPTTSTSAQSQNAGGRKIHPRPVTISGSGSGKAALLKGFDTLDPSNGSSSRSPGSKGKGRTQDTKSARQAIFETANVGIDLRDIDSKTVQAASTSKVFMKPAGVDVPKEMVSGPTKTPPSTSTKSRAQEIIEGARAKQRKKKDDIILASTDFVKPEDVDGPSAMTTDTPSGTDSKKKRPKREHDDNRAEKSPKKKKKKVTEVL